MRMNRAQRIIESLIQPSPQEIQHGKKLTAVVLEAVGEGMDAMVHEQESLGRWKILDDKTFLSTARMREILQSRILDMGERTVFIGLEDSILKDPHPYEHANMFRELFVTGSLNPQTFCITINIVPLLPLKLFIQRFNQDWRRIAAKFQEVYFHELTHRIQFTRRASHIQRTAYNPLTYGRIPHFGLEAREVARQQQLQQSRGEIVYGNTPLPGGKSLTWKNIPPPQEHFYARPAKSLARIGTGPVSPEEEAVYHRNAIVRSRRQRDPFMFRNNPSRERGQDLPPRVASNQYYAGQPEEIQAYATGVGHSLMNAYIHQKSGGQVAQAYLSVALRAWDRIEKYYPVNTPAYKHFMRYLYEYLQRQKLTNQQILDLIHYVKGK